VRGTLRLSALCREFHSTSQPVNRQRSAGSGSRARNSSCVPVVKVLKTTWPAMFVAVPLSNHCARSVDPSIGTAGSAVPETLKVTLPAD